jgi:potassium voltage-gated channel Eag-related subfamily H protein 8
MVNKLKGTDKSSIKHVKCPDGSTAETEKEIANTIASTLGHNSSSENYTPKFQKHKAQAERKRVDFSSSEEESYNLPFSLSELKSFISDLSCTAPGPDKIHNEILKRLPDETLALLLDFFNNFWTTHTFPDSWRDATIIPIPKPGKDHSDPSNYRPIALTSCLCKLMEKLVNGRLMFHLENSKLLSNLQCGFRKNRSTIDHLVRLERFIREAFANQEHLVAVFFDLEKAFDTTWKYGILKDLHGLGLRGHLPEFIKNFLSYRRFSTKVGNSFSDPQDQEEGVPQGSILSPILFEVKINSITSTLLAN